MTENQLYSMSTELFDTSSNSSNPLKYELYSLGLTNSVESATALFASLSNSNSGGCTGTNSLFSTGSGISNSGGGGGAGGNSSQNSSSSGSSNIMLTNAITIPRSNNPNQRYNTHQDEAQHHPTSSPFLSNLLQHQQLQLQPQQMDNMMSSSANMQQQQQQQQENHQHQPILINTNSLSDYSDYALDALDVSLSPTLLQDVSLSAAVTQSLTPGQNSTTSITSPFFANDPSSPLSNNNGLAGTSSAGAGNLNNISSPTDINGVVTFLNATAVTDDSSSMLYDSNIAPNSMWSDIGNAISTKNEPFSMEDSYIFQLDKSDVNNTGFGDFEGDIGNLEDITNLEDFLPTSNSNDSSHPFHLLSPSLHAATQSSSPSPGMGPPLELLQQHQLQQQQQQQQRQHQQQQQEHQHIQQFSEIQPMQTSSSPDTAGDGSSNSANSNSNSLLMQQQQQSSQSSSSSYEIYHSTPNKQQMQQQQQQQRNAAFSPGSLPSPLQVNSITPPPPHNNRSQYQQSQIRTRNMQELLKKGFSISPDRNNSSPLLGQSVPGSHGLLLCTNALSPSSGSSGFGSTNGANISSGSPNTTACGPVISVNSARKQFYQTNDGNTISRLSSSAPTHLGPADIWMRREPRQHLLSTGSLAEAESFSSLSTGSVLSPEGHDYSQDDEEENSTDYNSDHYDDLSSDNGSDNEDDSSTLQNRSNSTSSAQLSSSKGKERFFWQYNVQAKGPKGKRLVFQSKLEDPHVLNEVTDPVFSPNCSVRGIKVYKHSGKARKGDGNDLTPNPRKLHNIGKELDRLSRTINDMTPVSELPFNVRPKSRKEKNKLASRACRLKKKAQHEANKIKLFGLEIEHKRLLNAIGDIKQSLVLKYRRQNVGENVEELDQQIERIYKIAIGGLAIAGNSTDFVNKVLENVKNGQPSGGLEELKNT